MGGGAGHAEVEESRQLSVFQRIARSLLVVHVRVNKGSLKYARMDIIEAIKGESPGPTLRVAFRDHNWLREPGVESIVFTDGEEEILFLVKNPRRKVKEKYRDLFDLFEGPLGRMTLPAEGGGVVLDALHTLVAISYMDPVTQAEGFLALMQSPNGFLQEAALDEIIRMRSAGPVNFTDLVALLRHRAPVIRSRALILLRQIFSTGMVDDTGAGIGPDQAFATLGAVIERARNDDSADIRLVAVAAMAAWPARHDIEPGLRAIADQDPSQMVRYEAERALFRMRLEAR
jgi:hypothetical protein